MSQSERISPLLTDSLRQIKETLRQFFTGLPRFLIKWRFLQRIIKTLYTHVINHQNSKSHITTPSLRSQCCSTSPTINLPISLIYQNSTKTKADSPYPGVEGTEHCSWFWYRSWFLILVPFLVPVPFFGSSFWYHSLVLGSGTVPRFLVKVPFLHAGTIPICTNLSNTKPSHN